MKIFSMIFTSIWKKNTGIITVNIFLIFTFFQYEVKTRCCFPNFLVRDIKKWRSTTLYNKQIMEISFINMIGIRFPPAKGFSDRV